MSNYSAWQLNPQDFYEQQTMQDKIRFLVRFGILAPSSHNTQPWKFTINKNVLELYADFSRRLPESDPDGRLLYIALGCVVENIKKAASCYGLHVNTKYNDNLRNLTPEYALAMNLETANLKQDGAELVSILNRSSYRGKYLPTNIPQNFLKQLQTLNAENDLAVDFYTYKDHKQTLAEITGEGMKNKMAQKSFRQELARWVRTNFTQKGDGMPGTGHGLNLIKSILAPFVLRTIDVSEVEKKKAIKRTREFPAICIISSSKDNAVSWIKAGELLERILLVISANKMGASIMAAPIEDKAARGKLARLSAESSPQIFFGFGHIGKVFPHSPRRSLKEVLDENN